MNNPPVLIIDVGTSHVAAMAGRSRDGSDRPELLGFGVCQSAGMRKGRISNPEIAADAIENALEKVRAQIGRNGMLRSANVIASFGDVRAENVSADVTIESDGSSIGTVSAREKQQARDALFKLTPPDGRWALPIFTNHWTIDGKPDAIKEPLDRDGAVLTIHGKLLHMPFDHGDMLARLLAEAGPGIELENYRFSALDAMNAATTQQHREDGVLCIDFGGGTTSWCLSRHDSLVAAGSIPVGGDHVTNDLLMAFNVGSTSAAETLKRTHGSAVLDGVPRDERVRLSTELGGTERTAPAYAIAQVVNARLDETLRIIKARLEAEGALFKFGAGVLMCGRASRMRGLDKLVSRVFDAPCIEPRIETGYSGIDRDAAGNAAIWGALQSCLREQRVREKNRKGLFDRFVGLFESEDSQ